MKYALLAITFSLKILFANEYFLLPEHSSDALYALKKRVDDSKSKITFISAQKPDRELFSALRNALQRGVELDVITTSLELAASLAIYKNSHVMLLHTTDSETLRLNLLIIDGKSACSSSIGFSAAAMNRNSALFECSMDTSATTFYQYAAKQLKNRSDSYFIKGASKNYEDIHGF